MVVPPPASGPPLRVVHLAVRYGAHVAVRDVSFEVRPGEVYGLLGSNGAGKTSTLRSIVGLVRPAAGCVAVYGVDPVAESLRAKTLVGYVPETSLLYESLTPREFLEFVASVRRLPAGPTGERGRALVTAFRLADEYDRPIASLSNGTRQKVLLAAALLARPPLLVLDEPLHHLDPRGVRLMKELLQRYGSDGRSGVLLSTHSMEVAEQLCARVGILERGELCAEGSIPALRERAARGDASLEEIFLSLTQEEAGIRDALDALEPS